MNLAAGKAELSACPHVSEEAKAQLSEASAPPIRPLSIGVGDNAVKIGGETVEFRHEKTFINPPPLAVLISTDMPDADVDARLARLKQLEFARVGLRLRPEMVAVKDAGGDAAKFAALAKKAAAFGALILMSDKADVLEAGARAAADRKPLLYAVTDAASAEKIGALAKELGCPVAVRGDGYDSVAELTQSLVKAGVNDIVIDTGARTLKQALHDSIIVRRAALKSKFRPLGYPTIVFANEIGKDLMEETLIAAALIAKYAGIVVLSDVQGESVFPLLLERMNIYTDPQRPMATAQGIYEIGKPDENSPVLVTSNFSLTYFIVSGEIETSRIPAWLLIIDTEGLSVLTAWAAGKFVADTVGPFVKKSGIDEKVKHRKIVIPGYAAQISGELEEELPGWEILIGPREAAHLSAYLKNWTPN
jgi:acetyl-CoA decarbonylase/synthase complex subunit gamma